MHKLLFAALLAAAFTFGACSDNSGTSPATPSDASSSTTLSKAQEGELADVLTLGEDPASIMSPSSSAALSSFLCSLVPSLSGGGHGDARHFVDIAAIMYYRAALQANTDITPGQQTAIKAAIDASTTTRAAILADSTLTSADRAAALKTEHDKLMILIAGVSGSGGILTATQVTNTDALLAQIEAARQQHHAEMLEKRITAQIAAWDVILTFTDAQKTQIADLLRKQDADIQAARAQYQYDPEGFRAAALAIQTATQDAIRALLSDTQKPLWNDIVATGWTGWPDGGGRHGGHGGRHHG
jgi:hypothetical protein